MRGIRRHLSYSNVMVTLLAFIVLGGGAYAAFHLPRNSVRSKHIVNHQVKQRDLVKPQALKSAGLAALNSPFDCTSTPDQWVSLAPQDLGPVGYYRDLSGRVFLSGNAKRCGTPLPLPDEIVVLPRGYRPATGEIQVALVNDTGQRISISPDTGRIIFQESNPNDTVNLDGLSFRCGPSGKHGCP